MAAAPVNALDEAIGPFHDAAGVARRLNVSADTVADLARQHQLLACPTAEGTLMFPTFQFTDRDALLPGLSHVVVAMAEATADTWQVALWMRTPSEQLHGLTPHEALQCSQEDAVAILAAQTAARWRPH